MIRCHMLGDTGQQCTNPAINFDADLAWGAGVLPEYGMLICREHLDKVVDWLENQAAGQSDE